MTHDVIYFATALAALLTALVRWRREFDWRTFYAMRRELPQLRARVEELETRLTQTEADRARLRREKEQLQIECDHQRERIDALKAQNTEQAAEIKTLHDEIEELKSRLSQRGS